MNWESEDLSENWRADPRGQGVDCSMVVRGKIRESSDQQYDNSRAL